MFEPGAMRRFYTDKDIGSGSDTRQAEIDAQVAEFLAKGNEIQQVEFGRGAKQIKLKRGKRSEQRPVYESKEDFAPFLGVKAGKGE